MVFCCQMDVRTTVTATERVICLATRGYVDVETAGRAATVTLRWRSTVKAAVMRTTVCIRDLLSFEIRFDLKVSG